MTRGASSNLSLGKRVLVMPSNSRDFTSSQRTVSFMPYGPQITLKRWSAACENYMSKFDSWWTQREHEALAGELGLSLFFYQSKCEVTIRLVVFEKKIKMFVSLLNLFVFVQLDYSDQSDWSPHWCPHHNFHGQRTQSRTHYVFKLPALSQHQCLHSQGDCGKAGNSQLEFSFPVVLLAIKRKSQHLASSQTKLLSPFHPRKMMPSQGTIQDICLLMVLRVFHSLLNFIDTKKNRASLFLAG